MHEHVPSLADELELYPDLNLIDADAINSALELAGAAAVKWAFIQESTLSSNELEKSIVADNHEAEIQETTLNLPEDQLRLPKTSTRPIRIKKSKQTNPSSVKQNVDKSKDTKYSTDDKKYNKEPIESMLMRATYGYVVNSLGIQIQSGSFGLKTANSTVKSRRGRKARPLTVSELDSIGDYTKQIGKYDLIDKDTEFELSTRMRAAREASAKMMLDGLRHIFGLENMYSAEEKDMQILISGLEAKDHYFHANLRLVVSVAKRYTAFKVPVMDLIQEGNIGLAHAIDQFDERKGFKFSTYGVWWIKQAITRHIGNTKRTIRLPVHVEEKSRRIMELYNSRVSINDISEEVGINPDYVRGVITSVGSTGSTDDIIGGEDSDLRLGDVIEDTKSSQEFVSAENAVFHSSLIDLLKGILDEREIEILVLRYGLGTVNGAGKSYEEIGQVLDLTRERIRQIETKAKNKLRHPASFRFLGSFTLDS